jgi:hypothetical protein
MPEIRESPDGETLLRISRAVERFEEDWRRGEPRMLEELVRGESGPAARAELLRYALAVELKYRRERGELPTIAEYERRFPEHGETVRDAFVLPRTLSLSSGEATESSPVAVGWPSAAGQQPPPKKIGKYAVLMRLGEGGQGATYLASDPDLGHRVVLKQFHAWACGPDATTAIKEGQALISVRSRLTAQCYDLLRDGGQVYLVMEYIAGPNLTDAVKDRSLSPGEAARLVEHVAEAVEAVHACGLVHRDIKPANIIAGEDGLPRLVDFGLAAHLGSPALRVLAGTPPYMAPEQAREQWNRIDFRTDVYGLGATLYALLTGQSPHPGKSQPEALYHASEGKVTPPRAVEPKPKQLIPRALESIVMRALAADPAQRFSTAAEFREAVRRYRLRHRRRAATGLLALAALVLLALAIWPRVAPTLTHAPPGPLSGELTVRVWSPGKGGKQGWKVDDPRALPVLAGEQIHLEARLTRPAYAYLLWLDGQGQVVSLHPWHGRAFDSRPSLEAATTALHSPAELDRGWPMTGPAGLETALLLVRQTPLPADVKLADLIGHLPPAPFRDPQEYAVRGFDPGQPIRAINRGAHRSLGADPERIDDPLLQVMEKLRPHFEVIRAVRFAYQGESGGS